MINDKTVSTAARTHAAFLVLQAFSLMTFVGLFLLWSSFMMINWERLPVWEGRLVPVIDDFRIMKYEAAPNGTTNVWVRFNKVRPCQLVKHDAYFPSSDGRKRVGVENDTVSRPVGYHLAGPWNIDLPFEEFDPHRLRVDTTHRCHLFFNTVTTIYTYE